MPIPEKSSLRNTLSMSRCMIMFPAVARRSPAITTPPSQAAATIVVPCVRPRANEPGAAPSAGVIAAAAPAAAAARGRSSGAAVARKSVNDEVPAPRYGPKAPRP